MTPEQQAALDALAKEFGADDLALTSEAAARIALAGAVSDLAARVSKLEASPPPPPPPPVVWPILGQDAIQTGALPATFPDGGAGFGWCQCDHPAGVVLAQPSDALGANLSIVPDPLGGNFKCLRHYLDFRGGGRSQAGWAPGSGLATDLAYSAQAKTAAGVYVERQMYFPNALSAIMPNGAPDPGPWLSVCDFHSLDANGANRQHTDPGIFLAKDGSMRFFIHFGTLWAINPDSPLSDIGFPLGRWFKFEVGGWRQSATKDVTLKCWIDGKLVLTAGGLQTAVPSNIGGQCEFYLKCYGDNNRSNPPSNWGLVDWTPEIATFYTYDVRFGSGRLT